jgi:hypothetical protein
VTGMESPPLLAKEARNGASSPLLNLKTSNDEVVSRFSQQNKKGHAVRVPFVLLYRAELG